MASKEEVRTLTGGIGIGMGEMLPLSNSPESDLILEGGGGRKVHGEVAKERVLEAMEKERKEKERNTENKQNTKERSTKKPQLV